VARDPERVELLELDVDVRLSSIWQEAFGIDEWTLEQVAPFMRLAYARGHYDALTEPNPSEFYRVNGYREPERRR
jgi:hypothetical protein